MAAGFKTATVNASDVPATQTNFPAYVDLSRLGITTQAEADSVRVYADSGKTNELARDIASVSEMHVKVPSLTSTTAIYVDWDGVRSDYAATDTYGRNAVWTTYSAVWHLEGTTDSTGNSNTLTNNGSVAFSTALITNGADFANNNSRQLVAPNNFSITNTSTWSWSVLFKIISETSVEEEMFWIGEKTSPAYYVRGLYDHNGGSRRIRFFKDGATTTFLDKNGNYGDNAWHQIVFTYSNGSMNLYVDATTVVTGSNTSTDPTQTWDEALQMGITSGGGGGFNGLMDEARFTASEISDNWRTTQYHNHTDEAGFWGTWSDASGITLAWLRA